MSSIWQPTPIIVPDILLPKTWKDIVLPDGAEVIPRTDMFGEGEGTKDTAKRYATYKVPYKYHEEFIRQAVGFPTVYGTTVIKSMPIVWPWNYSLYAWDYKIKTYGKPLGCEEFEWADITIMYQNFPYNQIPDQPFLRMSRKAASDYVTLPQAPFTFSGGVRTAHDIGVHVGTQEYIVTAFQVPVVRADLISAFQNKVNTTTFLGCAAGTVLFDTWSDDIQFNINGNILYQVELVFKFRFIEHNKAMNPTNGLWQFLSPLPYPEPTDLNGIFDIV